MTGPGQPVVYQVTHAQAYPAFARKCQKRQQQGGKKLTRDGAVVSVSGNGLVTVLPEAGAAQKPRRSTDRPWKTSMSHIHGGGNNGKPVFRGTLPCMGNKSATAAKRLSV